MSWKVAGRACARHRGLEHALNGPQEEQAVEPPRRREFTDPVVTKYAADFTTHFFELLAKADQEIVEETVA